MAGGRLLFVADLGECLSTDETPLSGTALPHGAIASNAAHYAPVMSDAPDSPDAPVTLVHVHLELWETTEVPLAEAGEVSLFPPGDQRVHPAPPRCSPRSRRYRRRGRSRLAGSLLSGPEGCYRARLG